MSGSKFLNDWGLAPWDIEDPGDGNAIITEDRSGLVALVTAAAETRTLPDPNTAGLLLHLAMKTDGGDCVVTAASGYDATGNTIVTFSAVRQSITFISIPDVTAGTYRWNLIANAGTALS